MNFQMLPTLEQPRLIIISRAVVEHATTIKRISAVSHVLIFLLFDVCGTGNRDADVQCFDPALVLPASSKDRAVFIESSRG
jgi:hypothetical protein